MHKKTRFAIYTSFYNSEKYVDQIFDNILGIDYDNWKWFITDDFSTDQTANLLKDKIKNNNRIEFVTQYRKKEMYWQPNKFIPAEYEYILLVCSDDKVDQNILSVYDSLLKNNEEDISVLSCDLQEIYEDTNSLKSIGYVINKENIIKKLQFFYPIIDYVNNVSYFAFGLGICFKNYSSLKFEIDDFRASSEDFYRMLYMNSLGKWLHVPRNLYTWTSRPDSESRKGVDENFYKNFEIAFDKCKDHVHEPIFSYNESYKEFNSLMVENNLSQFKRISFISPWVSTKQKQKIREVYPEKNIFFNKYNGADLYSIVANYTFSGDSLTRILKEIKEKNSAGKIIVYYLDENVHYSNNEVQNSAIEIFNKLQNIINGEFLSFYYFIYFRHVNFIINI